MPKPLALLLALLTGAAAAGIPALIARQAARAEAQALAEAHRADSGHMLPPDTHKQRTARGNLLAETPDRSDSESEVMAHAAAMTP
jgi:hypothetical protein